MTDDKWIENLRKEEENFVSEPPAGLWEDIKVDLDAKKVIPIWLRWTSISAAACIVVLLGIGFMMNQDKYSNRKDTLSNTSMQQSSDIPEATGPRVITNNKFSNNIRRFPTKRLLAQTSTTEFVESALQKQDSVDIRNDQTGHETEESCGGKIPQDHRNGNKQFVAHNNWLADAAPVRYGNHHNNKVLVSLSVGNIMTDHVSSTMGYDCSHGVDTSEEYPSDTPVGDDPFNDMLILNQGKEVVSKTHHRLPIRIGFSVALPISGRWSIESGLTYSFLSSTIESGTKENYLDTKQELHYLGIPIKLKYDILRNKQINVYVTCGGMIEKCVYGKSNTSFIIGGLKSAEEKEKRLSEKKFQLSAILSAGIEANILKDMSMFVEPGMNYYIDNHSGIENSYKDKPLGFELTIGLRININR